jgi:hypothetical protein
MGDLLLQSHNIEPYCSNGVYGNVLPAYDAKTHDLYVTTFSNAFGRARHHLDIFEDDYCDDLRTAFASEDATEVRRAFANCFANMLVDALGHFPRDVHMGLDYFTEDGQIVLDSQYDVA